MWPEVPCCTRTGEMETGLQPPGPEPRAGAGGGWRGPAFGLVLTQSAGRKVWPGQSQARGRSKSCGVSCCLQASRTD